MTRLWTQPIEGGTGNRPTSNFAAQKEVPTEFWSADEFSASTDQSVFDEFQIPEEYDSNFALQCGIWYCANTTSTSLDARIDTVTQYKSRNAGEAMNTASLNASSASVTLLFAATAYALMYTALSLTGAVAPTAGDIARVVFRRDADHSSLDDLAVALYVLRREYFQDDGT